MHVARPAVISRATANFDVAGLAVWQVAAAMFFATIGAPTAHAANVEHIDVAATPKLAVALLITAGLATAVAFSVQTWAQRFTPPTHTAIIYSLEPVFAALVSFLVLRERLGGREMLGAGLILAGLLVSELRGAREPELPGVPAPPSHSENSS